MKDTLHKNLINFNHITEEVLDIPIFRVFSFERFLTSLHENSLSLVKTRIWEDPFEAFLLKQLIWQSDGTKKYPFKKALKEGFHGQCWTFLKESNLLWKAYAPNNDGVIVKTSLRKLFHLYVEQQPKSFGQFYLGKVDYWPESKIKEYFESKEIVNQLFTPDYHEVIVKSLFIKRLEFKQEEEIRLINFSTNAIGEGVDITRVGWDLKVMNLFNQLADELILDPRISENRKDSIISLIRKLGFSGNITKSTLFNPPILKLRID